MEKKSQIASSCQVAQGGRLRDGRLCAGEHRSSEVRVGLTEKLIQEEIISFVENVDHFVVQCPIIPWEITKVLLGEKSW